jgi:transposase
MNVYLNKFMVYFEIHRLSREGYSMRQISEELVINRRTVSKYLSLTEQGYELLLEQQSQRNKVLLPYEDFVKNRLELFRDTPSAQMHDWLKEHFEDLPKVSPKTVFNFVSWIRRKHNLPLVKVPRQYQMVEELPYGKQAQVDFGEYTMRSSLGNRVKVFFFIMVLSRSRYKYVWFIDRYFTSLTAVEGHERAFAFFRGIPSEIVYDQDKVFMVSENRGDFILTDTFRTYMREQSFSLFFCRKADPETKGKVENVVGYVKRNFLYNRTYHNIDTLNDEVLGWMGRTANHLPHAVTKKEPFSEYLIEEAYLTPYTPCTSQAMAPDLYAVRKDNSVSYKGNFYSLPLGTYQGKGSQVALRTEGTDLVISQPEKPTEICRHRIPVGLTGQKIQNTDHKRDKAASLAQRVSNLAALFADPQKALLWIELIKKEKPRYVRDQLEMVEKAIQGIDPDSVDLTLTYCLENAISTASDFKAILDLQHIKPQEESNIRLLNPLSGKLPVNAHIQPQTSKISDYEDLINKESNN